MLTAPLDHSKLIEAQVQPWWFGVSLNRVKKFYLLITLSHWWLILDMLYYAYVCEICKTFKWDMCCILWVIDLCHIFAIRTPHVLRCRIRRSNEIQFHLLFWLTLFHSREISKPGDLGKNSQWNITVTPYCARRCLKSPASRLYTQSSIQPQIKAPRHLPLCGEFTDDRWIPLTKGQ